MTGSELLTMTTGLLDGREIGDTLFYQLLNKAKNHREAKRPWRMLVTKDANNTASPSDTYATAHTLPSNYRRPINKSTGDMRLISSDGSVLKYIEIPYDSFDDYRDSSGYFAVDLANNVFYLSGTVPKTYTINLYYIKKSTDITSGSSWVFPSDYHPILSFDVAINQKGGIDYDDINARMVQYHGIDVGQLESDMDYWDATLQLSALNIPA